jgi:hypothetical protein
MRQASSPGRPSTSTAGRSWISRLAARGLISLGQNPWIGTLWVNLLLFIAGMLRDWDPIWFGVVTPPVAGNLYIAANLATITPAGYSAMVEPGGICFWSSSSVSRWYVGGARASLECSPLGIWLAAALDPEAWGGAGTAAGGRARRWGEERKSIQKIARPTTRTMVHTTPGRPCGA